MKLDKVKKAINFDLDTNKLEELTGSKTKAYGQIKAFMTNNGFEHRQGSGYVSNEPLTNLDIANFTQKISNKFTWLGDCVKEIDVTDIGEQYSLKDLLKGIKEQEIFKIDDKAKDKHISSNLNDMFKELDSMRNEFDNIMFNQNSKLDNEINQKAENKNSVRRQK